MKTRMIWTKIWDDRWYDKLSINARFLFMYLLTNQDINMIGCYQIPDKKIIYHTHFTEEELESAKKELESKVKFIDDWVYVINSQGYNSFTGASNEIAIKRELSLIPKSIKDTLLKDKPYTPTTQSIHSINLNHNININKSREIDFSNYKLEGNTYKEK
jgi:hypothetical protein